MPFGVVIRQTGTQADRQTDPPTIHALRDRCSVLRAWEGCDDSISATLVSTHWEPTRTHVIIALETDHVATLSGKTQKQR